MAKKRKRVKRVLGVKVPKPLGRFLATPGGQLAVAGVVVVAGVAAARSPRIREAIAVASDELRQAGNSARYAMGGAAKSVLTPIIGAMEQSGGKGKRKNKLKGDGSPRLHQDDYEEATS